VFHRFDRKRFFRGLTPLPQEARKFGRFHASWLVWAILEKFKKARQGDNFAQKTPK
jgi:hypothetical protein